ncbi:MAG: redoxin domain-containing protein [Chloroflexi bacterium]|nr:redoxin domain-containing protein [Chloroflexota bacterium]
MPKFLLIVVTLFALVLAACAPSTAPTVTEATTAPQPTAAEPTAIAAVQADTGQVIQAPPLNPTATTADRPAWQTLPLTNARTGETFTLADFAGRTVSVEPMATWCTNCRAQQQRVRDVVPQFSSDEVVFLSLSVEGNVPDAQLAEYADRAGFNWLFAVATPDMIRALVDEFGRAVTSPPSTPHFYIAPDGSFSALTIGPKSVDQLAADIRAASGA